MKKPRKLWVVETAPDGFPRETSIKIFKRLSNARAFAAVELVSDLERESSFDRGDLKIFSKIRDALAQEKIQKALKFWSRYVDEGRGDENTTRLALYSKEVQ